jgi:hypothetical protein
MAKKAQQLLASTSINTAIDLEVERVNSIFLDVDLPIERDEMLEAALAIDLDECAIDLQSTANVIQQTPTKAPIIKGETTTFVIRLTGKAYGRARYLTPSGSIDPWKFHSMQFATAKEAEAFMNAGADELKQAFPDAKIDVQPFPKAWFEQL